MQSHVEAGFVVGRPFATIGEYDFGDNSEMTHDLVGLGGEMIHSRLTSPPAEAYALHRRLSGAFLRLCSPLLAGPLSDTVVPGQLHGSSAREPMARRLGRGRSFTEENCRIWDLARVRRSFSGELGDSCGSSVVKPVRRLG